VAITHEQRDRRAGEGLALELEVLKARLDAIQGGTSDGIARLDRQYRLVEANALMLELTALNDDRTPPIGATTTDLGYSEPLVERWHRRVDEVFATGQSFDDEFTLTLRGRSRRLARRVVPEYGVDGRVEFAIVIVHDRTAEWEATQQLERARRTGRFATWHWHAATDAVEWSPEVETIFGVTGDQFPGHAWTELVHPDDHDLMHEQLGSTFVTGASSSFECRIVRPDGEERCVHIMSGRPVVDGNNNVIEIDGVVQDVTELRVAERELRTRELEMRTIVDGSPNGVVRFDPDGSEYRLSFVNKRVVDMLGRPAPELLGHTGRELGMPGELCDRWDELLQRVFEGSTERIDYQLEIADGHHWFRAQLAPVPGADGTVEHALAVITDITDEHRTTEQLRALVEGSPDAIARFDRDLRLVAVNEATARWLGIPRDKLLGRGPTDLGYTPDVAEHLASSLRRVIDTGAVHSFEMREVQPGPPRWFESTAAPEFDPDGTVLHVVVSTRDITNRKKAEDALAHQVLHDDLTGLPNRQGLLVDLDRTLERQRRTHRSSALLMADLDRFKVVNDSLGHATGDGLLIDVARRLRSVLRPGDTLARLGGDEFVVLLDELVDETEPARVADRLVHALRDPVAVGTHELLTTASIGIVVTSDDGTDDPGALLSNADAAMYLAKERGRDRYEFFDDAVRSRVDDRLALEGELRHAIERDELRVHYQPEIDLRSGTLIGAEALVRWEHTGRGRLDAAAFIRIAEETGQIGRIGAWVLDETCAQLARWRSAHTDGAFVVSMNVSPAQLADRDFPLLLQETMAKHHVTASELRLEMVETVLMADTPTVHRNLDTLAREMGVEFAIDDFGTGYSSLAYLKRFPARVLKIDRSFVAGLPDDLYDRGIVGGVVALARALGIRTTAEGVETEQQATALRELGVDAAQGYLYSKAVPADDITAIFGTGDAGAPRRWSKVAEPA